MNKLPIFEPIHYLGWGIVVFTIALVFNFIAGSSIIYTPWYNIVILFITLAIIDTINHILKLQ